MTGRIRDLTPADLVTIHRINQDNTPEVGDVDVDRMAWLLEESATALAIEVGGTVAGFCLVLAPGSTYDSVNYRWFADHHPGAMYLDRVAVDAGHRRRGLGAQLYDHVEGDVATSGSLALEINIDPPNPASLAFHDSQGFVEVGRQSTPYGVTVSMRIKHC